MKNKSIVDNYQLLVNKKITYTDLVNQKIQKIKESISNNKNIILNTNFVDALENAKKLDDDFENSIKNIKNGLTVIIKDNVTIADKICTSGSKILQNYFGPYNSTVVENILKNKNIILASANLDEFGLGGTGTSSYYGIVHNPNDNKKISGGSSSGSVVSIKLGFCDYAIGTDTGDSIRHPASYVGVVGFKPTYGLISRYGIMPYASSLDHVGIIANNVQDCCIGLDIVAGFDNKDMNSIKNQQSDFYENLKLLKTAKIAIFKNINDGLNDEIKPIFSNFINNLKNKFDIIEINFDEQLCNILLPIYYAISFLEGFSNWMNISGITFGNPKVDYKNYNDLLNKTRSNFYDEVKKRYLAFSEFYNEQNFNDIYFNSNKIKQIIVNVTNEILNTYDFIIVPSASSYAPAIEDIKKNKSTGNYCDDILLIANFAHIPSITIPIKNPNDKNQFGINIMSKKYNDQNTLNLAYTIEKLIQENNYYDK